MYRMTNCVKNKVKRMYIIGAGAASGAEQLKKKTAKKGVGGFSELLSDSEIEEAQTASSAGVSSTSSLLFMQEVSDDEYQRKEAVNKGFDALKYLDNIRIGLLCGTLSKDTIMGLERLLQNFRKNFNDPQLSNIIDEIELRARVEIAKLERN